MDILGFMGVIGLIIEETYINNLVGFKIVSLILIILESWTV